MRATPIVTFHALRGADAAMRACVVPPDAACRLWLQGVDTAWSRQGLPEPAAGQTLRIGIWDDRGAALDFSEGFPAPDGTEEHWSLALEPYAHRGAVDWSGKGPADPFFETLGPRPSRDVPIVTMTSFGFPVPTAYLADFGRAMMRTRRSARETPAILDDIQFQHRAAAALDPLTFTVWQSEQAAMDWAYRTGTHRTVMDWFRESGMPLRSSFTRLSILASRGRWGGEDRAWLAATA